MNSGFKRFLQRWIITTLAVLIAAQVVPGIEHTTITGLFVASLLLGIFNAILRPLLIFLSLPLLIVTLGLFALVINALLLYLVGAVLPNFEVEGFWAAFFGALIISLTTVILNTLTGTGDSHVRAERRPKRPPDRHDDGGPVIDV